jgi:transcriptional regulator with GAF, ATPase, and Fis domain
MAERQGEFTMSAAVDRRLRETFVELADTLVADYDIIEFLSTLAQRVVELLGVTACGVLLADHLGTLNVLAASTEQTRLLELFQLQNAQGPCLDAYRTGQSVPCVDLSAADDRWPLFAPAARAARFGAVCALPMRLREQVIGTVNLFSATPGSMNADDIGLGQSLADAATIGILHERVVRRHDQVADQLQTALTSRVLIEQAKGIIAERLAISVDDAFGILRQYARNNNAKLTDVAAAVVTDGLRIPQA